MSKTEALRRSGSNAHGEIEGLKFGGNSDMIKSAIRFLSRPFFVLLPARLQTRIRSTFNRDFRQERANKQLIKLLLKHTPPQIAAGPFDGMKYVTKAVNSAYCPKILGSYEKQLWPIINEIIHGRYAQVIDIGAAEGYYAIGLALKMPNTPILAFESDTNHHHLLKQLSRLNSVEQQVVLYGHCLPERLNHILAASGKTVIVCDVEGAEVELMNPHTIPLLQTCDLLIETHDFARPGTADFLRGAFEKTHSITTIPGQKCTLADWPFEEKFPIPMRARLKMLDEQRNGVEQEWLWIKTDASLSS
jgi:hypothetical protein